MRPLNLARRIVLSVAVPCLLVAIAWQVTVREDVQRLSGGGHSWSNSPIRDEVWFWPVLIIASAGWLWFLWPPRSEE